MEKKSIWKRPWFWIILIFSFFLLIIAFIFALRWFILYPWSEFWPHHKTSSEVDAAILNSILAAITSVATVAVTSWITYIINKQTQEITKEQGKIRLKDQLITKRIEFTQKLIEGLNSLLASIDELNSKRKEVEEKMREENLYYVNAKELYGLLKHIIKIQISALSDNFTQDKSFLPSGINKKVHFLIQKMKTVKEDFEKHELEEYVYNSESRRDYSEVLNKYKGYSDFLSSLKEDINETINYLFEADLNED